jgi:peptide/nickel transport system permease protein
MSQLEINPKDEVGVATTPPGLLVNSKKGRRKRLKRGTLLLVSGLTLFSLLLLASLSAGLITSNNPEKNNIVSRLLPPFWDTANKGSSKFLLGTDGLGRDVLARILYGMRVSLGLAAVGLVFSMLLGVTVGFVSGLLGGWVDSLLMRVVDLQLAFPYVILAIALVSAVGSSVPILILLLALAGWVYFARVVRSNVLQEMQKDYVKAAQVLGASRWRIGIKYIMPNVLPAIAVIATLQFPGLIIFEATLSFLGIGIQPPTPSLGGMMLEAQQYIATAWWIITLPGIAILLITLSLNLISDGLRQLLDPRLQTI